MVARMQTRVYRALLVQAGAYLNSGQPFDPERVEMIYWYADYPNEPACFPYNAVQSRRDWNSLTGLIGEITNHRHFPMTGDEKKCAFCPYRSYCNRGVKAGESEELEVELTEPDITLEQIQEIAF
jgi:CRISPR/Cas system-associated exonuclease Cas4 (RecB family)